MLDTFRSNFGFFGSVSFLFGVLFAFCFYKAGLGISFPLFIAAICALAFFSMKKLSMPIKKFTWFCYSVSVLLAVSLVFTANFSMQFLTAAGILILLEFSLIHQLNEDDRYTFFEFISRILKLPFGALAAIGFPFVDGFRFASKTKLFKNDTFRNILFGLLAAVPILGVILLLLSSADMIFDKLAGRFVKNLFFSSDPFFCILMALAGFLFCYAVLCAACGMSGERFILKTLFPEEEPIKTKSEILSETERDGQSVVERTSDGQMIVMEENADCPAKVEAGQSDSGVTPGSNDVPCSAISASTPTKKVNPVFLSTILASITFIYVIFCGIQILYLFAGGLFTLPEQFTYSEYARKGFFELLFVAVLNFVVLIFCLTKSKKIKAVKILLTAMSGCTFIMIASAAYRMGLYVSSYHLTMLRLLVLFFLGILTVLMAGAAAAIYTERLPLFLFTAAVLASGLLLLNVLRPDTLIASYNLSAQEIDEPWDIYYLIDDLSIDAAPRIFEYLEANPELLENRWNLAGDLEQYARRILNDYESRGIRSFNVSYLMAYNASLRYLEG